MSLVTQISDRFLDSAWLSGSLLVSGKSGKYFQIELDSTSNTRQGRRFLRRLDQRCYATTTFSYDITCFISSIPSQFTCPSRSHPVGSCLYPLLDRNQLHSRCHLSKTFGFYSGQGPAGLGRGPCWFFAHRKKSSSLSSRLVTSKVPGLFQQASFFPLDVFHLVDILTMIKAEDFSCYYFLNTS